MDPYIFAGSVIVITFAIGAYIVKCIYNARTHDPQVDTSKITDKLGLDMPDGVDVGEALGGVFK